jgi:hypothetical protein
MTSPMLWGGDQKKENKLQKLNDEILSLEQKKVSTKVSF